MTTDELRDAILLAADTAEPGPDGPYRVYPPEPWAKGEAYSGKPPIEKVYYYVSESDAPGHRIEFYSRRESAARAVCHALNRDAKRQQQKTTTTTEDTP